MFNLFIKSNTLFRAISGVFSASQPQPNGCVCDAANETTRLGFAEQRYWLHGIFWSIGSILPIKTQNSCGTTEQRKARACSMPISPKHQPSLRPTDIP